MAELKRIKYSLRETEHRLSSLCTQRSCTPLMTNKKSGQHVRWAHRAEPYVPAAAAVFFVFFSAPLACSPSFFDLRAFFSAASSIS